MTLDQLTPWAVHHPTLTATGAGTVLTLAAALAWVAVRVIRTSAQPAPVRVAAIGAIVCTAYTADTSWRFAADHLGMNNLHERGVFFAAAEVALLACGLMARAHKKATATDQQAGTTGVPGTLVWVITGVQVIPAYAESGPVGGTVRAVIGPIMAGLLWHLAMGLEIRLARPRALASGLLAQIGRELRERLLSHLGLATRDRTAEQITRDRAITTVVRLASRRRLSPWGQHRLAAAAHRSGAATDGQQHHQLMQALAGRRTARDLQTVPLRSPWVYPEVPAEPYPRTPLGVTGAQLRTMDPLDAVLRVHAAHPDATPAELASLCTEYGVPVSETQVRIAVRAAGPDTAPGPVTAAAERPVLAAVPEPVPAPGLVLDLVSNILVHPEVQTRVPALAAAGDRTPQVHARIPQPFLESLRFPQPGPERTAAPETESPVPAYTGGWVPDEDVPEGDQDVPEPDPLIEQVQAEYGTEVPGVRTLKARFGIGQKRAQRIRDALAKGA